VRFAWLVLVCACGDDLRAAADGPDIPLGSFEYKLHVAGAEPPERPPSAAPPTVFIDGVARSLIEELYPDEGSALGVRHLVELRTASGDIVRSFELAIDRNGCLFRFERAELLHQAVCAYDSGDLRFASERALQGSEICYGDAFCFPDCFDDGSCPTPEQPRCTSRATATAPFASHLACAPAGPRSLGESCALVADPAGAYDDCGAGLLCVEGTCRTVCRPRSAEPGCATCAYVPGHAPEIGVCGSSESG
jgi:hypothetical protein